ncbi:MAG: class I tRNA ligase family protein, partial [Minisyncoccia bacterium]
MKQYDSTAIEKKWQQYWSENQIYKTPDHIDGKENFYALSEFAYPSGNLHVGHWYAFAVPDIYARFKRMNGYNVLYPMGFDAFGLPAENAAIKRGLDPRKWTYENMDYMKKQLASMGASFDWDRTLATSDPAYYKWTQWMFTQFYKNDLVKRSLTKTNWCESCKTVLANEQVVAGECERCGDDVIQRDMAQWMFKITDFADDLVDDLKNLEWDESIKQAQREWIGRKEGGEISFPIVRNTKFSVLGESVENAIERNIVKVILRNSNREILVMKSILEGSMDLPGGGIDQGETVQEAALRELQEETKYTNFKFVSHLFDNELHYHHIGKKQDQHGTVSTLLFDLIDDEEAETKIGEHEPTTDNVWLTPQDAFDDFVKNPVYGFFMKTIIGQYI